MRCNVLKDLLPLYIDGLTSEESNREIEKHLKECDDCKKYYNEMVSKDPELTSNLDVDDTKLLINYNKKRKKIRIVISSIILILLISLGAIYYLFRVTPVNYSDVIFNSGVNENGMYIEMKLKEKGILLITSGENINNIHSDRKEILTVLGEQKGFRFLSAEENNFIRWEVVDKSEMMFEFSDKVVTIKNGEIIIKDKIE